MHEQGIAQEIIKQATAAADGKTLKGIVVEVGQLGHLPSHEMREVLVAMLPGVDVTITDKEATVLCASCGHRGAPTMIEKGHDHNIFKCSGCGAMLPKIIDGTDIVLVSVDVGE